MSFHRVMEVLVWGSFALLFYTFFGYGFLLVFLSALRQATSDLRFASGRRDRRAQRGANLPQVSLVFAAYNEEGVIQEKLRNCAALEYPFELLEILVGADGCSDRTVELGNEVAGRNVRIFDYTERSGKPMVLNKLVPETRGEIVVFSDANTMIGPESLRNVVRHFANRRVGCVSGELRLKTPDGKPFSEGLYWKYEIFLKIMESRLNMVSGAHGGIFAIRRELYEPLPKTGIIDDFLISMRIRGRGYRCVYDPETWAEEVAIPSVKGEFGRRIRISAGGFHAIVDTWRMLLPTAGLIALSYWSHKVLRWLAPFAMILAFAGSLALINVPPYAALTIAALLFTAAGIVGYSRESSGKPTGKFAFPYYFLSMHLAMLLGFFRFAKGTQRAAWARTSRETPSA
jgi:cellulose synthase/poly-beta-1,6-N-acetylglucosamine synthase-like glycosyltransferase